MTAPPSWGPPPSWEPPPTLAAPAARRSVLGAVAPHLVLWPGLVVVAFAYRPIARFVVVHNNSVPYEWVGAGLSVFQLLPVALALVVAGRGVTLWLAGALGAVTVLAGAVVSTVVRFPGIVYPFAAALAVLGLGTWIGVRRHARIGYLALIPAAVVAVVWFGPIGRDLRNIPYEHQFGTITLLLWNDLLVVALAVLGLVSSLLRPRPAPGRDGIAFAVVGGLIVVAVAAGVVAAVT